MYDSYEEYCEEAEADAQAVEMGRRYASSSTGTRFVSPDVWESPAERDFAAVLGKYLRPEVEFEPGRNVATRISTFRCDMVLTMEGRRIGIEVDGKHFHDRDHDWLRDSALLAGRIVHVIYRFAASRTLFQAEDCLYVLAHYEPRFFDPKGRDILIPRLASNNVKSIAKDRYREDGVADYGEFPDESDFDGDREPYLEPSFFHMSRRTPTDYYVQRTNRWIDMVIDRHGPLPFPRLLEQYKGAVERSRHA